MSSYETDVMEHKMNVQIIMNKLSRAILIRGRRHDNSKLKSPEKEGYSAHYNELRTAKFGSPEYQTIKEKLEPVIQHHYAENDHHPEHFGAHDGIFHMDCVQIIEMLADWVATAHHKGTDVVADLPKLMEQCDIPENYYMIFKNTVEMMKKGLTDNV